MKLQGVLSAIVTPFDSEGQFDEPALRALVDQSITDGVHGFVPAGGTGEFSVLSHQERLKLIEVVVEQTNGRATVLAHTGATSSKEAVEFSRHAERVGATAIMLATPYYERIGFEEAFSYYAAVADATSLPICAYNFPPSTGLHLNVEFLLKLNEKIPQVQYVKDSSADIAQMYTLLGDYRDRISFLNGEDIIMLPALMLGAPGMVMGIANFMAPALRKLHDASQAGDDATVAHLWRQINPVIRVLGQGSYNSGVKAACELLGLRVGPVRAPIRALPAERLATLKDVLSKLDPSLLTGARR
ncbi:dihydrodipicolinate synthase family protein [Pararobbsia silviterrae]|uniref:Dihydrodipicolinate synthase family protein n=1 Tax=Pararobbsia silviterrae TaxID=1792498 RepID=A0A494Y617_9BURK|nr:dihydrodipicolinate synthase family protein [Pararobbsia silviterrae]RKP57733.1 dihydrodipicolinate synthase family protein [Pararobbsia silviterrae]